MQFIVTLSWYEHRALVQRQADKSRLLLYLQWEFKFKLVKKNNTS